MVTDVIYYNDGDESEGECVNGEKTNKGISDYANGSRYEGNFDDNKMTGKSIFYFADGRVETGEYVNGEWVPDNPVKLL